MSAQNWSLPADRLRAIDAAEQGSDPVNNLRRGLARIWSTVCASWIDLRTARATEKDDSNVRRRLQSGDQKMRHRHEGRHYVGYCLPSSRQSVGLRISISINQKHISRCHCYSFDRGRRIQPKSGHDCFRQTERDSPMAGSIDMGKEFKPAESLPAGR